MRSAVFRSKLIRSKLIRAIAICLCLGGLIGGCGGNTNETEYLRNTPPGGTAEPESVASRRERTKAAPKTPEKGTAAKRKAAS
jgi:hypothetical protein